MKGYNICECCGHKIINDDIKYFELIHRLRKDFEIKYGVESTHLIVGVEDYYNIENSKDLLDRLIRIMDCSSNNLIGTHLCGLIVIKSSDFEGISVARL